jgi:hypothetical protein
MGTGSLTQPVGSAARTRLLALLAVLVLTAAACRTSDPDRNSATQTTAAADPLAVERAVVGDVVWTLTSATVDGTALALDPERPIDLRPGEIRQGSDVPSLGGYDGCNWYIVGAETSGADELDLTPPTTVTAVGCGDAHALIDAYGAALGRVTTWQRSDDRLVLSGRGVELVFGSAA